MCDRNGPQNKRLSVAQFLPNANEIGEPAKEDSCNHRVEMRSRLVRNYLLRLCRSHGFSVGPVRCQGIKDIGQGDDSGRQGVSAATSPAGYRRAFREWLPTSGRKLRSAPCFEVYVSDPATTPFEELVTEIYFPLMG
jgi:hypothetical protein